MATFTDEEYADQARVERGLERFHQTIVPFGLDPDFGTLRKFLLIRDELYGHQSPAQFSVLDGVGKVESKVEVPNAVEFFGELVGGTQRRQDAVTAKDFLDMVIEKYREPSSANHVTFYLLSPDKKSILGIIDLKDSNFTVVYRDPNDLKSDLNVRVSPNIIGDNVSSADIDRDGRSMDALYGINSLFEKTKQEMVSDVVPVAGPYSSTWNLDLIIDSGIFNDELLRNLAKTSKERVLADPKAREMCLMMTEVWIEPAFEFSDNVPHFQVLNELAGNDRTVEGNCVEQSIANAINSHGGLAGEYVHPRFRVLPSNKALKQPEPSFHLDDVDPLCEQTLSRRLFGDGPNLIGSGTIEEQGITELGATVQVPGHQFFARREGDKIDVYDTAMRFCGSSEHYFNYLEMRGMAKYIRAVNHFAEIDPVKSKFFDKCREPYRNRVVYDRTREIFGEMVPSERHMDRLYSSWNQAVGENPDLIASAFKVDGRDCQFEHVQTGETDVQVVSSLTLDQMILSQETGFVCIGKKSQFGGPDSHMAFFKDGENIFFTAGRDGAAIKADKGKIFGDHGDSQYFVTSFGGNDLDLMRGVHEKGVQRQLEVKAQTLNDTPVLGN